MHLARPRKGLPKRDKSPPDEDCVPPMKQNWVGVFEVRRLPNSEVLALECDSAFVNIVGKAHRLEEFKRLADAQLESDGLQIVGVNYIDRVENRKLSQELKDLLRILSDDYPIQYGTFYSYDSTLEKEIE